jgi:hypothetical protein
MRRSIGALVVLCSLACKGESPTEMSLGPPTFSPSVTFAAVGSGGAPNLAVSVTLRNHTAIHLQANESASCPFAVGIAPYPGGNETYIGVYGCPAGAAQREVAPGDSVVLTGMIGADTLATFAPHTYQVSILVGTTMSIWAGTIQLPLMPPLAARSATAWPPPR